LGAFGVSASTLVYEPFYVHTVLQPYVTGANLSGLTNRGTQTPWMQIGSGDTEAIIGGNQLTRAPLATSRGWLVLGNADVFLPNGTKMDAALPFNGAGTDVYYSFLFTLNIITNLGTNFAVLTQLSENTNAVGVAVAVRANAGDPTLIDLAISKTGDTNNWITDVALTTTRTNTHLLVVKYEASPGVSNDVMKAWLNPAGANISSGTEPTATFSTTTGDDTTATNWNTFELYPPDYLTQGYLDEIRVATSWTEAAPEGFLYEGFDYTTNLTLLTFDSTGTNTIGGLTNSSGFPGWSDIHWNDVWDVEIGRPLKATPEQWATASTNPLSASIIHPGSLTHTPLAISAQRLRFPPSIGSTFDQYLEFASSGANVFCSFLFRVDDLNTNLSTNVWTRMVKLHHFLVGDANDGFSGPAVMFKGNAADTNKFDLGIHKRANSGATVTDPALQGLSKGTPYLVVFSYEAQNITGNTDPMRIWLNPDPASFGTTNVPTPTLSSIAGSDAGVPWSQIEIYPPNFVSGFIDELRVGWSWAKVTPVAAPTVDATPTNIVASVSGSTLELSWPASHIGWTLQCQTNPLSSGLNPATGAWTDVTGSASTNVISVPMDPANPTVFYRLRYLIP
jgi:hypothetical protein